MFYMSPSKAGLQRLHSPFCKQADVNQMKKLSVEIGHHLNVPADGMKIIVEPHSAAQGTKELVN